MIDEHAARELRLYIDNDSELHRQQGAPILKNLATKKARGQYKHDLAVKLFGYLVESGAKKYHREHGNLDVVKYGGQPWHKMFDVPTRRRVAEELTDTFEAEAKLGNYDNLLPKKYQSDKSMGPPPFHGATAPSSNLFPTADLATRRAASVWPDKKGGKKKKSPAQLNREINEALAGKR